jgi:F0F1-type ATP synthase assembly protein I
VDVYKREVMPSSSPSPERQSRPRRSGAVHSLAQAERLLQIAFVMPCAMVLCWGAGWWLDHHFHTKWIALVGVIVGIIAGMVSAIRMALDAGKALGAKGGK